MFPALQPFARALLLSISVLALPFTAAARNDTPGVVYTLNNAPDVNRVFAYARSADGTLTPAGEFPTGGRGTGAALGSQGALALSADGRWLLAVNAGSSELSVFAVQNDTLVLRDVVPSGGLRPTSVAIADNLVYVLNAGGAGGGSDTISGFYLSADGRLHALPGSTRALSGASVGAAQVSFGLRGDVVIVTERATQRISGFAVDSDGRVGPVNVSPSAGPVPFGFAISSRGHLFVSEAPGSALSSYALQRDGAVELITGSLPNRQGAACWVVLSKDEHYAFTANAATNSISAYRIAPDGSVSLVASDGLTAVTDDGPLDLAVSNNGRFLYALNGRSRTIVGYLTGHDGSLVRVAEVGGLRAGSAGLVAR